MQNLIEDLLIYSRAKSTDRVFETADLKMVIEGVLTDMDDVIRKKSVTVEMLPLDKVSIIPFQIRQLIENLIGNSIKFAKKDVPLAIRISGVTAMGSELGLDNLHVDKKYYHITLSDNGIGFEPQYSERIFEVFQRLHSFEEYHGTGIGLAICKRIMENHGGFINAIGVPDVGAKFDVYIPVND